MAADEAGFTQEEYRNDPKKMAESFITAIERYRYDGVLVDYFYGETFIRTAREFRGPGFDLPGRSPG